MDERRNEGRRTECRDSCFRNGGICVFHDGIQERSKAARVARGVFVVAALPIAAIFVIYLVQIKTDLALLKQQTKENSGHIKSIDKLLTDLLSKRIGIP